MNYYSFILISTFLFFASCSMKKENATNPTGTTNEVRLITLDPGHFHAALVQKKSYPQVSSDVYVYAPQGDELTEHLKRIEGYNTRAEVPTQWKEIIYTGDDFLQKMRQENKGNVLVTAGNNGKKTQYIYEALTAGLHVLADKPMAIRVADFEKLKECFEIAEQNNLLLYDIMTERFEITSVLQKEFSLLSEVYGEQLKGTLQEPGIVKESVHHFLKTVSGSTLKRPAWFFDTEQQGAGIVDVATHLVDLVQWECFPDQVIHYETDIELVDANHWSTALTQDQFKEVTGLNSFPEYLNKHVSNNTLHLYSNGDIYYRLKGIYAKVSVTWNYSYPQGGGDTHYSIMRGSKAHLIIKQGKEQHYKPILYVKAVSTEHIDAFEKELLLSLTSITKKYAGVGVKKIARDEWVVEVPETYHVGHEAHFGQVADHFFAYLKEGKLPAWEVPNMIAKYYTTTHALEMAKKKKDKASIR